VKNIHPASSISLNFTDTSATIGDATSLQADTGWEKDMATNFFSVHKAAQIKQQVRRKNTGNTIWAGKYLQQLSNLGERLLGDFNLGEGDYETLAIGIVPRAEAVIVCSKGFELIKEPEAALLIIQTELPAIKHLVCLVNPEPLDETAQAHLHSEMGIIQYVVRSLGCNKERLNDWGVEIACIRKGVCPDCSGWLNQHAVPHTVTRKNVASLGWSSPLSGAFYKLKGNDLIYNKGQLNTADTKLEKYTGNSRAVKSQFS
jgi:hypothetical protein